MISEALAEASLSETYLLPAEPPQVPPTLSISRAQNALFAATDEEDDDVTAGFADEEDEFATSGLVVVEEIVAEEGFEVESGELLVEGCELVLTIRSQPFPA